MQIHRDAYQDIKSIYFDKLVNTGSIGYTPNDGMNKIDVNV